MIIINSSGNLKTNEWKEWNYIQKWTLSYFSFILLITDYCNDNIKKKLYNKMSLLSSVIITRPEITIIVIIIIIINIVGQQRITVIYSIIITST